MVYRLVRRALIVLPTVGGAGIETGSRAVKIRSENFHILHILRQVIISCLHLRGFCLLVILSKDRSGNFNYLIVNLKSEFCSKRYKKTLILVIKCLHFHSRLS